MDFNRRKNIPLTKASQTNKKGARLRPSKKDIQEKAGLTIQEQNELKEHKKHLPNYGFKKRKKQKTLLLRSLHSSRTFNQ
ncbi:hypothetical protein GCM10025857_60520 [Alicyclobacillus contaminans]|nr:hypothetical protein GCM10025857_60520 [Alicyclobacillus contaminans]